MHISSNFDGGNIECLSLEDPSDIQLNICADKDSEFFQWFYFRLVGAKGQNCNLNFLNASQASYQKGWEGYNAVASYDRETWFRVATSFEDGILTIGHKPEYDMVYYAYFAPYSMERHADLLAKTQQSPLVELIHLGQTLDGQDMDLLKIGGDGIDKKKCWAIARQHPGETMAEWWMEGFLGRLTDPNDAVARSALDSAVFYVVPNMNPDGSRRGHLRTNAAGANLNREWTESSMERSPEVFLVREQMVECGVDFCLDVHGDEGLPYNFIAGTTGVPSWNDSRNQILEDFKVNLQAINPDFQTTYGYPANRPGKANMALCSNNIAEKFGCPAMTLEMPFKDTADTPMPDTGWSPDRCKKLGSSILEAILHIQHRL